jgi:hypothetical protein
MMDPLTGVRSPVQHCSQLRKNSKTKAQAVADYDNTGYRPGEWNLSTK